MALSYGKMEKMKYKSKRKGIQENDKIAKPLTLSDITTCHPRLPQLTKISSITKWTSQKRITKCSILF